ncbi:hypothetical protein C3E93_28650, partial [Klebsiella pneumoniae]
KHQTIYCDTGKPGQVISLFLQQTIEGLMQEKIHWMKHQTIYCDTGKPGQVISLFLQQTIEGLMQEKI